MRVDVALSPLEVTTYADLSERLVVVIDVLRATTTIATALALGARAVWPTPSPEAARALAKTLEAERPLLAGEANSLRLPGFDLGNSPLELEGSTLEGRPLILTTTNGTRTLHAVRHARQVITASFVNLAATVAVLSESTHDVLIVCSGHQGASCLEDAACAGMIVDRLENRIDRPPRVGDGALIAQAMQELYPGTLELLWRSEHGRDLVAQGFEQDLPACAQIDRHSVVPCLCDQRLIRSDAFAS